MTVSDGHRSGSRNRILRRLPDDERDRIASVAEAVELDSGDVLSEFGARVAHVYFPHQGSIALYATVLGGAPVGTGLVQADGVVGLAVAAGRIASVNRAVAQGWGHGERVPSKAFRLLLPSCPELRAGLLAYACASQAQAAQNVACVSAHQSSQRVARWMLDLTDRASPSFSSTQEGMAIALGLQRAAVSNVATDLQRSGVIRYMRGDVTVLDRPRLSAAACQCTLRWPKSR